MSAWEATGQSDEWYTPKYIFDALGCQFDMDVAAPMSGPLHVPCDTWIYDYSLSKPWPAIAAAYAGGKVQPLLPDYSTTPTTEKAA